MKRFHFYTYKYILQFECALEEHSIIQDSSFHKDKKLCLSFLGGGGGQGVQILRPSLLPK